MYCTTKFLWIGMKKLRTLSFNHRNGLCHWEKLSKWFTSKKYSKSREATMKTNTSTNTNTKYKYTNIWNSRWQAKGETKKTKFVPDILRALHPHHPFNQLFKVLEQFYIRGVWFFLVILNCSFFFVSCQHLSIRSSKILKQMDSCDCKVEAVRPYCTKPGTQEMSLMALTLYF